MGGPCALGNRWEPRETLGGGGRVWEALDPTNTPVWDRKMLPFWLRSLKVVGRTRVRATPPFGHLLDATFT